MLIPGCPRAQIDGTRIFSTLTETKKPKKVANKIWGITTTAVNEMWIARNRLEQVTRVKAEGLNERVKAIFDSGALKHLDITCDEVIRTFRTKKKASFVDRYEKIGADCNDDDAIDIDLLLKEALSRINPGDKVRSVQPTGKIMEGVVTGLVPATGEAEVRYVDTTWVESALHTAQTIVDSSGLTKAEEDKLNMVYKDTSDKSKAVIKNTVQPNKAMAYKVVNFAGEATIMSAQELCDDAQDKPKVIGRRKRVANANQRISTENETWAADIRAARERSRKEERARKRREKKESSAQGTGEAEHPTDLTGNGPEGVLISGTASAAACSTSAYRGGVFNSMD